MSSYDEKPIPLLAHLERSIEPDPQFAARLRTQVVSRAGMDVPGNAHADTGLIVLAEHRANRSRPGVRSRHRLLDLAAVAILLLTTLGVFLQSTQFSGTPATPTVISAPDTSISVMQFGGTAAQDYQYAGPAPVTDTAEIKWKFPEGIQLLRYPIYIQGDLVYAQERPQGKLTTSQLVAYDRQTGVERWRADVANTVDFIVTSAGIVTTRIYPTDDSSGILQPNFSITLLDLQTGKPIWITTRVFLNWSLQTTHRIVVEGDVIYMTERAGRLIALDLHSGQELWIYAIQETPGSTAPGDCQTDSIQCLDPGNITLLIAIGDENAFVLDPLTGLMSAVSLVDGREMWRTSLANPDGHFGMVLQVTAFPDGVLALVQNDNSNGPGVTDQLLVMNSNDGSERWQVSDAFDSPVIVDNSIFVGVEDGSTPEVRSYDGATGALTWTTPFAARLSGYLPASHTLVMSTPELDPDVFGFDLKTQSRTWTMPTALPCSPRFPIATDGSFTCTQPDSYDAYLLGPAAAPSTPFPTDIYAPQQDPVEVNQDPTGSGQISGPAPTAAAYTSLWKNASASGGADVRTVSVGERLFYISVTNAGEASIVAADLKNGSAVWTSPIVPNSDWLVTDQGIVVLVPGENTVKTMLERLDLTTGSVKWQSTRTSEGNQQQNPVSITLAGGLVLVGYSQLHLIAYTFATGEYAWEAISSSRPSTPPVGQNCSQEAPCTPPISDGVFVVASGPGRVYIAPQLRGRATALDADTGLPVWPMNDFQPNQGFDRIVSLIATDSGLLVQFRNGEDDDPKAQDQFSLLSLVDGSPIWTKVLPISIGRAVVTSESELVTAQRTGSEDTCCDVIAYNLGTGRQLWRVRNPGSGMLVGYLSSSESILFQQMSSPYHLLGIGSASHAIDWEFANPDPDCYAAFGVLPIGDQGAMGCFSWGGGLTLIVPDLSSEASPDASPSP